MLARIAIATLFTLAAGTAWALIPPPAATELRHETVIEKNQAFPLVGPLIVEECLTEACMEVQT
jgi:hypothetical protein